MIEVNEIAVNGNEVSWNDGEIIAEKIQIKSIGDGDNYTVIINDKITLKVIVNDYEQDTNEDLFLEKIWDAGFETNVRTGIYHLA